MANCYNCKNAYIEDIWMEWDCHKSRIKRDDEGIPSDEEFECQYYENEEFECGKEQKLCSNGKPCTHPNCERCGTTHFVSECDYGKERKE